MERPGARGLLVEAETLLVVFSAGFLAGRAVAGLTGSRWWGLLSGAAVVALLLGFTRLMRIVVRITGEGIVRELGDPP